MYSAISQMTLNRISTDSQHTYIRVLMWPGLSKGATSGCELRNGRCTIATERQNESRVLVSRATAWEK